MLAKHPLLGLSLVLNRRTQRWRLLSDKSIRRFGIVTAWRFARVDCGELRKWTDTHGPDILAVLTGEAAHG